MLKQIDNIKEFQKEFKKGNYVRAESLSPNVEGNEDEKKELRKKMFKQFIIEFRNPQGAYELAKEYGFSKEEINRILDEIIKEAEERKILDKSQFDIKTMKYLSLREWIFRIFQKMINKKLN